MKKKQKNGKTTIRTIARQKAESPNRIYTDGSGSRPDGKGSAFAWACPQTGEKKVVREDGLTNNQAEYRGIIAALEECQAGSHVQILTDSQNTCFQLKGWHRVKDPHLAKLYERVCTLVQKKKMTVEFEWVPRRENLAGKLL
jgi:ribonuclease HI